jgi:hypothetical protein
MTELYIDQDALDLTRRLGAAGLVVTNARESGISTSNDEVHFLLAARSGWTLITHNIEDFKMLHRAWLLWNMQPNHSGVLILPQADDRDMLAHEVIAFFAADLPLTNECYIWSTGLGWLCYAARTR